FQRSAPRVMSMASTGRTAKRADSHCDPSRVADGGKVWRRTIEELRCSTTAYGRLTAGKVGPIWSDQYDGRTVFDGRQALPFNS
ncbi:hypothetical protein DD549_22135, partial [Shewanella algae]